MKTISKIFAILIIAISLFAVMPTNMCFADAADAIGQISTSDPSNTKDLADVIGKLLGFLQVASGLAAVLMLAFTGFNYIVSTPEVKDEMKKKMFPIVLGIVIVFGATSIAKFLIGVAG